MGFFSDFMDDTLGFDPKGGGVYSIGNNLLGDTIYDDILGYDPNGGGIIPFTNAAAPLALAWMAGGMLPGAETTAAGEMAAPMSMESAAAYDAGLAGVGSNVGAAAASPSAEFLAAQGYDAGLSGAGTSFGNMASNVPVADLSGSAVAGTNNPYGAGEVPLSKGLGDLFSAGTSSTMPKSTFGKMAMASSLYDMFAKPKMAQAQQDYMNRVSGMYAPGTPEARLMEQQIARKDAAAGRNSQYGVRAQNLAALLAKERMGALTSPGMASMFNQQQANKYGALNTPMALATMYSMMK